jgi:hypothetical protein
MRIRVTRLVLAASLLGLLVRWMAGSLPVEHARVRIGDARAIHAPAAHTAFAFDATLLPIAEQTAFVLLALLDESVAAREPTVALVPWGGAMTAEDIRRVFESDPGEGAAFLLAPGGARSTWISP